MEQVERAEIEIESLAHIDFKSCEVCLLDDTVHTMARVYLCLDSIVKHSSSFGSKLDGSKWPVTSARKFRSVNSN